LRLKILTLFVREGAGKNSYIYSASGEELAKKMKEDANQYYEGNMVYNNNKLLDYFTVQIMARSPVHGSF